MKPALETIVESLMLVVTGQVVTIPEAVQKAIELLSILMAE